MQAKGFFQNDLIQIVNFLENFSVKEPLQRDTFLRKLDMQIDRLPQEFCKYKVLPELIQALEYGSGGAKVLAPIVKIGATLEEQEYEALISNVLVKMFASTDRSIRLSLLENLSGFIERINKKVINEKIFPSMVSLCSLAVLLRVFDSGVVCIVELIRGCSLPSIIRHLDSQILHLLSASGRSNRFCSLLESCQTRPSTTTC